MAQNVISKNTTEQALPGAFSDALCLLRSCLCPEKERPEDAGWEEKVSDWAAVRREMRDQAVDAMPGMWLRTHTLPDDELRTAWQRDCLASQAFFLRSMRVQTQLLSLLEENGIPAVIIKGAASAEAYPQPSLRRMGDIDFLVKRSDYDRANRILAENGYVPEEKQNVVGHHMVFQKDGVVVECHRRFATMKESHTALSELLEEGIDQREYVTEEGVVFPRLPVALHGFSLLLHIDQHLSRTGLGLRHFVDWQMFLEKYGTAGTWDEMLPLLRMTEMEKLFQVSTSLCRTYLGLERELPFLPEADPNLVDELLLHVAGKGNFGEKVGEGRNYNDFFVEARDARSLFGRLQRNGLIHWKAAQKHRWLRPFAWLYQMGSIGWRLVTGKVTLRSLKEHREQGERDADLARKMGSHRKIR